MSDETGMVQELVWGLPLSTVVYDVCLCLIFDPVLPLLGLDVVDPK